MIGIAGRKHDLSENLFKYVATALIIFLIISMLYRNTSLYYRKKIIQPISLRLNRQEIFLVRGERFRLFVYGINKRVTFYSTNFRVADVDLNGRVYAFRPGKAFIIAKVGNKKLKCRVKVIDLNKKELNLNVGETFRLKIKGPVFFASYKSSNPEVAKVSFFGKIKTKKPGRTRITVYARGKKLTCTVTVR